MRHKHILNLKSILQLENSKSKVELYTSDLEKLTQIILDCSVYGARGLLNLSVESIANIERTSRNLSYDLHKNRNEILGLKNQNTELMSKNLNKVT